MDSHDQVRNARPSTLDAWPKPLDLLHAAARRWFYSGTIALLCGLVAGYVLWRVTPLRYDAAVQLEFQAVPPGWFGPENDATDLQAQADIINSPAVRHLAAGEADVADLAAARSWTEPVEQLGRLVRVQPGTTADELRICVRDENAAVATVLVQATADAYLKELRQRRAQYLQQLKDALAREAASVVKEVPAPAPVPVPLPAAPNPRLGNAETELVKVQAERRAAVRALLAMQEIASARSTPVVTAEAVEKAFQQDELVQKRQRELQPIDDVIQKTLRIAVLGEREPSLRRYVEWRDAIRKELAARRAEIRSALEKAETRAPDPDAEAQILALQERTASLAQQERALKTEIESLQEEAKKPAPAPPPAPPVVRVAPPPAENEERRKLEAEIRHVEAAGLEPNWVRIALESFTVDPQSVQKRQARASLGAAGAALLGVLCVGFTEFRRRRVTTARDVSHGLGLPVFGTLPRRLKPIAKALTVPGPEAKAIDALRNTLLDAVTEGPCVILVTSPGTGKERSALAAHLAASLARSWHKTVLLDGDLRRPTLQRLFGLADGPGFAEVLRGETEDVDAIQPTALNRLWVMPAGRADQDAIDALTHGDARAVLVPLQEQFDCVVVDAAALGLATDALLLAPLADVVVLSVVAGVSCLPEIDEEREQLLDLGCQVVGAVVIGVHDADEAGRNSAERRPDTATVA